MRYKTWSLKKLRITQAIIFLSCLCLLITLITLAIFVSLTIVSILSGILIIPVILVRRELICINFAIDDIKLSMDENNTWGN